MRALAMAALLTSGCATATPPTGSVESGKCDASKAQALVGLARTVEVGAEALWLSGARDLRWIEPGTMVTMAYREDRLNLRVDADGKVLKVNCG
jgi:hypothetical protein